MSPLPEYQPDLSGQSSVTASIPALLLLVSNLFNDRTQQRRVTREAQQEEHGQTRNALQALTLFQNMDQLMGRDPDDIYELLWEVDKENGCALKLTCSLAALPKHLGRAEDMLLLRMFGKRPFTVTNDELSKPSGIYKYAAFMGAKSMNQQTCDTLFKACPMPGGEMVSMWRSVVQLVPSIIDNMKPGK